jgi:hypothetical protein
LADDLDMGELLDNVAVAGKQNPDVAPGTQRPGQGSGNCGQSAHANEIVHLRRDKKNLQ